MALRRHTPTSRASAALAAAGAYDASPTALACDTFNQVTFLISYTRGGAAGAVSYKIEFSIDGTNFFQNTDTQVGAIAAGSDTVNLTQRAENSYTATGAAKESFASPTFTVIGNFMRINFKETGNVGAPGTVACTAYFRQD